MKYALGKKDARPDAVKFKFSTFFDVKELPEPPTRFGHIDIGQRWEVLGNDKFGCCVFSGAAHETMVWLYEGGKRGSFNDNYVLEDYSAVTGFNRSDPDSDQGADMQQAASYRRKTGIADADGKRHTIDSYVALQPGNIEQIASAAYTLGVVGIGLQFPGYAERQFAAKRPWEPLKGTIKGGHYVPIVGRNSVGNFLCVTWGRLHAMTPQFLIEYMDEGLAYVSFESLKDKFSPEGFDAAGLQSVLAQLKAEVE